MLNNPLYYDPAPLKAGLIQRHGVVLGEIVFAAVENRRLTENVLHAELRTELSMVQEQISMLARAAGEQRARSQERLTSTYSKYLAMCDLDAKSDADAQSKIAALNAKSRDLQEQLRGIDLPRLNERELQDVAAFNSANSERLRAVDKKPAPLNSPQPSALAQINMGVGLQQPRS